MALCLVAMVVFSILGIFSAKWRRVAKESFQCVFKMIQFKPCDVQLEEKIKSKVTSKLLTKSNSVKLFQNTKSLSSIGYLAIKISKISYQKFRKKENAPFLTRMTLFLIQIWIPFTLIR